jgi:hypothetical protein
MCIYVLICAQLRQWGDEFAGAGRGTAAKSFDAV